MTLLKSGELFAGYGGLALAVEHALNATTAWVCEFEEAPSKILAQHFPEAPNFRDVTAVDWETVPPVDIISGGSPCQDVSLAGSRRGMTDGTEPPAGTSPKTSPTCYLRRTRWIV